jgi:hypothetical protein
MAAALNYKDIYQNGTQIAFFFNGTIASFNSSGALISYIVPP